MTAETQQTGIQRKTIETRLSLLPWIVAAGAILLYLITLNHWVTLSSLPIVSKITGWDWHPAYADQRQTGFAPLFYVLTLPFRVLPTYWQPIALNAFSAVCAALTLGLLARSVRLLPHDRTRDQRVRSIGDAASLQGWYAFVPPVLAALVCGLQVTFWENSVAATGEMLDALVFAYLIRCLLEFRISRKELWLSKFVLVYGLGVTNNWALIGFFPFFLTAFIWCKGKKFFNWKFIGKMAAVGLAGLSLYLLLPIVYSTTTDGTFLNLLAAELKQQKIILFAIPRWIPLFLSLPTIFVLFFIGIRWPSFQGDTSAIGAGLSLACFRLMHVVFFGLCVWVFMDIQYSPRVLGVSVPFLAWLSFYYMAALSVGYFSGYILLYCGTESLNPMERRRGFEKLFFRGVTLLVYGAVIAAPVYLVWANLPKVNALNGPTLSNYASEMTKAVPAKGAIVLCDDPSRLMLLQAYAAREKKPIQNILIESSSWQFGEYFKYLRNQYPPIQNLLNPKVEIPPILETTALVRLLYVLNTTTNQQTCPIYYLHPSFGIFFERFYTVSHGLSLELKPYALDVMLPPVAAPSEIEENERAWNNMTSLAALPKTALLSEDAKMVARWQSRAINYWGVELQKANRLKEANARFTQAIGLYPDNYMAQINKACNVNLQQASRQPADTREMLREAIQKNRSWASILSNYGPPDEPGLDLELGQFLASLEVPCLRQAFILFQRRLALVPGDFQAQLAIAKTYLDLRQPDKALTLVRQAEAQATTPASQAEILRVQMLSYLYKNEIPTAEKLLKTALAQRPTDETRISLLTDLYKMAASIAMQEKHPEIAQERLKTSLGYIDSNLNLLKEQNRLGGREEAALLFNRAQLLIQLADYPNAIASLDKIVRQMPDNPMVLLTRANAEVQLKKFADAKHDYKSLLKLLPAGPYTVYYGLAEVAFQEKDQAAAIKNYKLYQKFAPTNAPEYKLSTERLASLQHGP